MLKLELPQLPHLRNKTITVGVCGGIAAYKSAELVRLLVQQGCRVQVVMTPSATQFIQPLTFQALSGRPVHVSQWPSADDTRGMPHIDLSRSADCLLIAPCTANSMAKYAHGLGDNLLDNLVLARNCPVLLAPAMNVEMWNNPATQRNLNILQKDGVGIAGPAHGQQACGEVGAGRMLEPVEIVFELSRFLGPRTWAKQRVLLTAGPTFEAIDPVRGITNRSSGKMGYAMAQAAWLLGAEEVTVVSGPVQAPIHYGLHIDPVDSAKAMHTHVMQHLQAHNTPNWFIAVAAVADYGIKNPSLQKQKKIDGQAPGLHMEFELNPDILATVGDYAQSHDRKPRVVGFAAETQRLDEYAQRKLHSKKADWIVGNLAQDALGADLTTVSVYGHHEAPTTFSNLSKLEAALAVLQHIA